MRSDASSSRSVPASHDGNVTHGAISRTHRLRSLLPVVSTFAIAPRRIVMENQWFETLNTSLGGLPSRRDILRGLASAGLVLTGHRQGDDAVAKRAIARSTSTSHPRRHRRHRRHRNRPHRCHSTSTAVSTWSNRARATTRSAAQASAIRGHRLASLITPTSVMPPPIAAPQASSSDATRTTSPACAPSPPVAPHSAPTPARSTI